MSSLFNRFSQFPKNHVDITAAKSDTVDLVRPMLIFCGTTGTIAVMDDKGTSITYTIDTAGAILPIIAKRVLSTGTNITQIIGLY